MKTGSMTCGISLIEWLVGSACARNRLRAEGLLPRLVASGVVPEGEPVVGE